MKGIWMRKQENKAEGADSPKRRFGPVRYMIYTVCVVLILAIGGYCYLYGAVKGWFLPNGLLASLYPIHGVDVSHYQGDIDWTVLGSQNITFAYIKATEGSGHTDQRFPENWEEADKNGIAAGAYHFFSFDSPGESQALHFIQTVGDRRGMLPPVVDFEFYGDKKRNPPPVDETVEQLQILLSELERHYAMTPVIYATESTYRLYLKGRFDHYPLWIRSVIHMPLPGRRWTFWQYANKGKLKGYSGEPFIDLNVFNGNREQWNRFVQESCGRIPGK